MLPALYRTAVRAATPLIERHLQKRAARGKEDPARANERRGRPARPRGDKPLVWFHGASVGESVSLLALIARLLKDYPGAQVMVTTGTVTSAKTMAERLPEGAFHQYLPVDHPDWAASFLDHWKPGLLVWTESDFRPAMLLEIGRRKIPAVSLNAGMSEKSRRRWSLAKPFIREMLSAFDLCLAQSEKQARGLEDFGVKRAKASANLKYSSLPLPFDQQKLDALKNTVGKRPLFLWASSHPGEEDMACRVHARMKTKHPDLLTLLVPRHIARGKDIKALCEKAGLKAALRSEGAMPGAGDDVYIADTMGELGLFYRLSRLAVVGGSFCFRSHNPIEPAQLGCVIFYGPVVDHIVTLCEDFENCGGALRLPDEAALTEKVAAFLDNPAAFDPMAEAALALTRARAGIIDEVAGELAPFLQNLKG
jgi:3-deoxy-D-manno-octulosonic-acid transferase